MMDISNPVCAWHFACRCLGSKVSEEETQGRPGAQMGWENAREDSWHEAHVKERGATIDPPPPRCPKGLRPLNDGLWSRWSFLRSMLEALLLKESETLKATKET